MKKHISKKDRKQIKELEKALNKLKVKRIVLKEIAAIVRCKDCKYAMPDMVCSHPREWGNEESRNGRNKDWFCADGERKE